MRNLFHNCMVITALIMLTASFFSDLSKTYGQEERNRICRACLDCPTDKSTEVQKEVVVPKKAVMLNEEFTHCSPDEVAEPQPKPLSVFIIIDHSGSMATYDPKAKRYEAARALIDTLDAYSKVTPEPSEVGIAIFSNKLLFHSEDDPIFRRKKNSHGWKDSYIPITKLDKKVDGMKAADKLKWALELDPSKTDPIKTGNYLLVNGNYTTSGRRPYAGTTDVSLVFEAAVEAMKEATHPKDQRFIVFFSDGFSQYVDAGREKTKYDYIEGKNVPCTFTAFFTTQGQPIPNEIKNMTENIRKNGYSKMNEISTVWRTHGELTSYFNEMIEILKGTKFYSSKPKRITINKVATEEFSKTHAFFKAPFAPLNEDGKLTLDISYKFRWDSPRDYDTTRQYTVNIVQGDDPEVDTCRCWYQGKIAFFGDDGEIKDIADRSQKDIEVRFYPPEGEHAPRLEGKSVDLELTNKAGSDKLKVTLHKQGKYYLGYFKRDYGKPKKDDDILQNSKDEDKIVAIYRNPEIPLDIVEHSVLSSPEESVEFKTAYYLDEDANGFPDKIQASQISDKPLTEEECILIKDYSSMDAPRRINEITEAENKDNFIYFSFDEPDKLTVKDLYTAVYTNSSGKSIEKLMIDKIEELPSGATIPSTEVILLDRMGPVIIEGTFCPAYITDETAKTPDTLIVKFSEPVNPPANSTPFKFIRKSEEYSMKLRIMKGSEESNVQRFLVSEVEKQPKIGDLLWINHTANVKDANDIEQKNENNRRAPMKIKPHRFTIAVTAWPNPSTPDDFLNHKVRIDGLKNKKGVIIKARIIGKWFAEIGLTGTMQLFDGVGNSVIILNGTSADDEKNDGIKESVIFVWNGANTNSRKVYSGGYFGLVTVTSEEGYSQQAEIMLGVKSEKAAQ